MNATAKNAMQPDYLTAYRSLKLARDAQGVLAAEFHSNGKPLTFTARDVVTVYADLSKKTQERSCE